MSRFHLSNDATRDLREILAYLDVIPDGPALRTSRSIQKALRSIAQNPYHGMAQSELTRVAGQEVRSRVVDSYRIFYLVGGRVPEVVGVLHAARDSTGIMTRRLQ